MVQKKSRVKVGAVSFLNTKPLIYTLSSEEIELSFDVPSRLADDLKAGHLDVAIIPIIEYFRAADELYRILPHISISSRGAVRSIQLFSRIPIPEIRRVALDTSSRTSRTLVQILLAEKYQIYPEFISCLPTVHPRSVDTDATLLIGDAALRRLGSTEYALDLGAEWQELTGLPFVYACWVVRDGVELRNITQALLEAKESGIARIPEIARVEAEKLGLPEELCQDYLTHRISFDLGDAEIAGLMKFYEFAVKYNLATPDVPLRFVCQ